MLLKLQLPNNIFFFELILDNKSTYSSTELFASRHKVLRNIFHFIYLVIIKKQSFMIPNIKCDAHYYCNVMDRIANCNDSLGKFI